MLFIIYSLYKHIILKLAINSYAEKTSALARLVTPPDGLWSLNVWLEHSVSVVTIFTG